MSKKLGLGQLVHGLIEDIERGLYIYASETGGHDIKKKFHPTGNALVWETIIGTRKFKVIFEPIE